MRSSVVGGSTGPGYKAWPFLTKQKSFPIYQNNLDYHPGPVSPPNGDGSPLAPEVILNLVQIAISTKKEHLSPSAIHYSHVNKANQRPKKVGDVTKGQKF